MNTSKLRQELSWFFKEIEELKGELITRKPMARGTVYELKRKCGKSMCISFKVAGYFTHGSHPLF